jgi:SAM-dependent methyltransferase
MPNRWNDSARLRASQIEAGLDLTFSKVFVPLFVDEVRKLAPATILEAGGGTGHLARSLFSYSDSYTVVEPSLGMYLQAQEVLAGLPVSVCNSSLEDFAADGGEFDFVLSHMCVHTVDNLDGFLSALASVLNGRGRYSISLPHPVFYNDYKQFFPPNTFNYIEERTEVVSFSVTLDQSHPISGVPYHHRPISTYVSSLSSAGLCVTSFDEIFPSASVQALYGKPWQSPRYLVLGGHHIAASDDWGLNARARGK